MRRAAKVDANQPEIVGGIRGAGFIVFITSGLGFGFPDIVVVDLSNGRVYLVEIKATVKDKLTPMEKAFAEQLNYSLPWLRIHSAEEFIEIANKERLKQ